MTPNAANICVNCLRSEVDITEGLQKHVTIMRCPKCESYLQPPKTWIKAQLESNELLTFCLKKLKTPNNVVKKDAAFIWTEPNSKRIKVKVKVQKEVLNEKMDQSYIVEYVVVDHVCDSCSRVQANSDQWVAKVQLRQYVSHRRSFFYLEQLILKHDAALRAIKIKQVNKGIDFFFANRSHALTFVNFVGKFVPIKKPRGDDKQLVSHDRKSNNYNYKYTYSVEICPICREDLVCLPPKVSSSLGNLGPLVLCTKVSNNIVLFDPLTLREKVMEAAQYWRNPFGPMLSSRQFVRYKVRSMEFIPSEGTKYALANVEVVRASDIEKNDKVFNVRTHLGHLLKAGDYALGYDLHGANTNDTELDKYGRLVIPDAILIKKCYEEQRQKTRGKSYPWKLKSLNMEVDSSSGKLDEEKMNSEYKAFLQELEENPELTFNISLYRNKDEQPMPIEEFFSYLSIGKEVD
ncbi:60S ribosomal export protein NMD3 [Thalictrum thalictroides]|uniref:60S ribosomal export protein NMD3 n=1 Tax=Thalictrum thalictroides TaxID=46969 RepID=A0A7J6UWF2_THATH|nr:60S ribosomal export protein NMD3 [Thalictrum thalictroides]